MERTRLSDNLFLQKAALAIIFVISVIYEIQHFDILVLIFIPVFGIFGYQIWYLPEKIEFDEDYMYIIEKDGEITIELRNIFYVSPVSTLFNPSGLGKIKYRYENEEYSAQFRPRMFSRSFKRFTDSVLEKNPRATIKGYTPEPFDFN
jgi:hypothetical protein